MCIAGEKKILFFILLHTLLAFSHFHPVKVCRKTNLFIIFHEINFEGKIIIFQEKPQWISRRSSECFHMFFKKASDSTKVEKSKMKLRSEDLTPKCLQGQSSIVALTKSFSKWLVVLGTPSSLVVIFEKLLLLTPQITFWIRNYFTWKCFVI